MLLKRPPRSGLVPCERGQLGVSLFPFFPSSLQLFHDAAIHRSQLPGSAVVAAEPRFSLCGVFYWCWWLARPRAQHHTHRLWSPRVRLCEGCAGESSVNDCTLSATERQLFTWTWCECRAGMHSGVFKGRTRPVFSKACPFNCPHVHEQLQPTNSIVFLFFSFLLRQI